MFGNLKQGFETKKSSTMVWTFILKPFIFIEAMYLSFDILTEALVRFLIQSKFHGRSKNPPRLVEREFLFHF